MPPMTDEERLARVQARIAAHQAKSGREWAEREQATAGRSHTARAKQKISKSRRRGEHARAEAEGRRLRVLRTRRGMTMELAALRAGITPNSLYRIEVGLARPKPDTVAALAQALRVADSTVVRALPPLQRP